MKLIYLTPIYDNNLSDNAQRGYLYDYKENVLE